MHHSVITSHIKDETTSSHLPTILRKTEQFYHANEVVMLLTHFFLKVGDFPD
jgi:hypothetical protein